jgi:autotransporter-associated beta strand protein
MKRFLRLCIVAVMLIATIGSSMAQRKMEVLDRGVMAVKVSNGVFVSWRLNGYEWYNTSFNLYRDGVKINTLPLEVSNFNDASGTLSSSYTVRAIVDGVEQAASAPALPLAQQYLEVLLKVRDANIYQINDATAADLDGDGQYEIIIKRIAPGWNDNNTNYSYFEAYKLDGTFLWEINVGPNILPDVEINIAAFDFDEDGKAEVFMRTSEGTIFGNGVQIGDTNGDGKTNYRYSVGTAANMQYMNEGPEFLSLIDGMTGAELHRVDFIPRGQSSDWGDSYGHRASKYFFGAPYLDGKKPSLFIGRGIYTKTVMRTYDIVDKKMVLKWQWAATDPASPYFGQGNHNYTIADTDGDGCDEIVWGSMVVDNTGQGLFSTGFGHGDALHVGDLDPYRKGTEIFKCLEESPHWGTTLFDGKTGEILIHHVTTDDCGRCMAGNVSNEFKGKELWGGNKMFSATTRKQVGNGSVAENFRIYWDGDLLEEQTDHVGFSTTTGYGTGAIMKHGVGNILTATGSLSNNYTKGTPSLQADLFGDWREEVIWRRADNQAVRIYTTIDVTAYRNYSLLHDHQYRQAVCWQMCGYNQPPHVSYFLGEAENMTVPPPPAMSNQRLVYEGSGVWDNASAVWNKDGVTMAFADGEHVLFDDGKNVNTSVTLAQTVSPAVLTVNKRGNCNIDASAGKLSGSMLLAKQGDGTLVLNGNHDYNGTTSIWNGSMAFNGELQQSAVWMNLHTQLAAVGKLLKGVTVRYNSVLSVGPVAAAAELTIGEYLNLEEGAILALDVDAPVSDSNDKLILNGNLVVGEKSIIRINPIYTGLETKLDAGDYTLMTISGSVTGDLSKVIIEGIDNNLVTLEHKDGKIVMVVKEMRASASLLWNGGLNNNAWDFGATQNFLNGGTPDLFLAGDNVSLTEASATKIVNFVGKVRPTSFTVNTTGAVTLGGSGSLSGAATLTKQGISKLTINNENDFTGKVLIEAGTVEVSTMPNLSDNSAFGPSSSVASNFEINGGTLRVNGDIHTDRAMLIGTNGGTIETPGKLYLDAPIVGGNLVKTGTGNLYFGGLNSISSLTIKAGTAIRLNEETSTGATVIFEGGTYQDKDNSYSYNTNSVNFSVATGKTGTLNLDSRCYYTGSLTGAGSLTVFSPFVRADLRGNWSAFTGTITFNNGSSGDIRFDNAHGYANAAVVMNGYAYHVNNQKVALGSLAGSGTLAGSGNWEVGAKNTVTSYPGLIASGSSLSKVGTGRLTLTSSNTYTGGTVIGGGYLIVSNTTGSATGTGAVNVNTGGNLSGTGFIGGKVYVNSGGALLPGVMTSIGQLTVNNTVALNSGGVFYVDVDADALSSDLLKTTGAVTVNQATLKIRRNVGVYNAGDEFKIIDAPSISGAFAVVDPLVPAAGMEWDLSALYTTGVLKVVQSTGLLTPTVEKLSFYPNPTQGMVHVVLNSNEPNGLLTVEDTAGRTVLQQQYNGTSSLDVDLSGMNKGVYLIRLVLGDRVLIGKIILK